MNLTKEEIEVINSLLGDRCLVMTQIDGKCFALNRYGTYTYYECFEEIYDPVIMERKYVLLTPLVMIKYIDFYLMKPKEQPESWYRGFLSVNGNYEFDCYMDSLEELVYSL